MPKQLERATKAELVEALAKEFKESNRLRSKVESLTAEKGGLERTLERADGIYQSERASCNRKSDEIFRLTDRVTTKDEIIAVHDRWMTLAENLLERLS